MDLFKRFQVQLDALVSETNGETPVIAYSGGVDSHVLLHLCHRTGCSLRVVHINHQLQYEADSWSDHCQFICEQLNVPFKFINVTVDLAGKHSPEDAARRARYAALEKEVQPNEILLTAHHAGDQSETVLLQLFRGAGPAGLASMPLLRTHHGVKHGRPLLSFSRDELHEYAVENKLQWIEDPSNVNDKYDRNFIRHNVMPLLKSRWPQLEKTLTRAAEHQQESLDLIDKMAAINLSSIITQDPRVLSVAQLLSLDKSEQLNVLRFWLRQYSDQKPTANILKEIIDSLLPAPEDAQPVIRWGNAELRRYQNGLYLLKFSRFDSKQVYRWAPGNELELNDLGIKLSVKKSDSYGLNDELLSQELEVRFRQGGEVIKPFGKSSVHCLKKLMQEARIPPWERNRIPLIYFKNDLVCVCGHWLSDAYVVRENNSWVVQTSVI